MAKLLTSATKREVVRIDKTALEHGGILFNSFSPDDRAIIAESLGEDWYEVKSVISYGERLFIESGRSPMNMNFVVDPNAAEGSNIKVEGGGINPAEIKQRMILTYLVDWSHTEPINGQNIATLAYADARAINEVIAKIHRGQRVQPDAPLVAK